MKKSVKILTICLSLILVLSLSFASAGLFSDFLNKITGKAAAPPPTTQLVCTLTKMIAVTSSTYQGSFITSVQKGDEICASELGNDWKWLEFHEEFQWDVNGQLFSGPLNQRAWVWINDQNAECFSTNNQYGMTWYVSKKFDSCGYALCNSIEGFEEGDNPRNGYCNPYQGETLCSGTRSLLCVYKGVGEPSQEPQTCTESWNCDSWSECINNQQTRTCTDANNCGTTNNKPEEVQACILTDQCIGAVTTNCGSYNSQVSCEFDIGCKWGLISVNGDEITGSAIAPSGTCVKKLCSNWNDDPTICGIVGCIWSGEVPEEPTFSENIYRINLGESINLERINVSFDGVNTENRMEITIRRKNIAGELVSIDGFLLRLGESASSTEEEIKLLEVNTEEDYIIIMIFPKYFLANVGSNVIDEFSGKEIKYFSPLDLENETVEIEVRDVVARASLIKLIRSGETTEIYGLKIKLVGYAINNGGYSITISVGEPPPKLKESSYSCQDNTIMVRDNQISYNCVENKCSMELTELEEVLESCGSDKFCVEGIKCCMPSPSPPEKNFPIGIYVPSPDRLDLVQELGVNTVIDNTVLLGTPKNQLEKAQEYDFKVIVNYMYRGLIIVDTERREFLKQHINAYCTSPYYSNLYRSYLMDEPNIEDIEGLATTTSILEELGPSHPGVWATDKPLLYKEFLDIVHPNELFVDIYPIRFNTPTFGDELQKRLDVYNYKLRLAREASIDEGIPFWSIIQVHSWGTQLREPTPKEIREMVYLSLTHGAKGVFYFLYKSLPEFQSIGLVDENGDNPNEKYYEIQEINNELEILAPILLELESTGVCNSNMISEFAGAETITIPQNMCKTEGNSLGLKCEEYAAERYCKAKGYVDYIVNSKQCDGGDHYAGNHANGDSDPLKDSCGSSRSREWILTMDCQKCALPNIESVSGNIEVGTFRDKLNNDYVMLVNRDTNNPVTTTIELSITADRLVDMLTDEEFTISEGNIVNINLDDGDGRLLKIESVEKAGAFSRIANFFRRIFR